MKKELNNININYQQNKKKVEKYEDSLKIFQRDMTISKMKSTFFIGITMIFLFSFINSR